jgi:hypothetical protein
MGKLDEKAERLVRAGAVRIVSRVMDPGGGPLPHVIARVDGDTDGYDVELGATGDNTCGCPAANVGRLRCSHIRALQLYERVGDLWAAEQRALERTRQRRVEDGPPLGSTKTRETRWLQDRKGRLK